MDQISKNAILCNHTIPAYHPVLKGDQFVPEQTGSASVLKFQNQYYIVTAGHVLDVEDINHLSFGEINESQLHGCVVNFQNDETIDAGVVKITETLAKQITIDGKAIIDLDNKSQYLPMYDLKSGLITLAGYPGSQQKLKYEEKKLKVVCKIIAGPIQSSALNTKTKVAFQYDRNNLVKQGFNQLVMGPLPNGMSGSPVWVDITNSSDIMMYAGIAIEYYPYEGSLVVTRSEVVMQFIHEVENKAQTK